MPVATETFGTTLRWWRTTRRFSQLQLALDADVSSRHISFLETGRAKPSREMVIHLAVVLDLPLRDRNQLLHSAGFAPAYSHSEYSAPTMDSVRSVISEILTAHLPNPAVVVDRRGDLVDANVAGIQLIGAVVEPGSAALQPVPNLNRLTLHPDGIKNRTTNWSDIATNVLQRLEREQVHRPADQQLSDLLDEVLSYPDIETLRRQTSLPTGADLLVTLQLTTLQGRSLTLVSTIATIGAPYDITLDELRLETFFPADKETRVILEDLVGGLDPFGESSGQSIDP